MLPARFVLKPGALRRQLAAVGGILGIGAAWGVVLGIWGIAPMLVDAHRLAPRTPGEWVVLVGALVAMSAVIGAMLSPVAGALLILGALVRRRPPSASAGLLFAPPGIAVAYFAASALVEWWLARRTPLAMAHSYVAPALAVAAIVVLTAVAHRLVRERGTPSVGRLLALLAGAVLLGAVVLPFRVASRPISVSSEAGPLIRVAGGADATVAPLLLVGIDSGNWDTIAPLVEDGALPTFARLIAGGRQGEIEAIWPPYWSGPAWAAILTGHPREETGIFGNFTAFAPGLPPFNFPLSSSVWRDPYIPIVWRLIDAGVIRAVPTPRTVSGRPPVWELLSRAGLKAGVVRMDLTQPPAGQADVVISNYVGNENATALGGAARSDLVAPAELQDELLAPFSGTVPFDAVGFERILPATERARSPRVAFEIDTVKRGYDIDYRTIEAVVAMLRRRPDLQFVGVHLGGFDAACHAMWQYRFPEAYGPARPPDADLQELRGVIDRYLVFLDASLARLIAAFPHRPNVIIVSDHGHTASPQAFEFLESVVWRGWHGPLGIFVAHGPGVPATSGMRRVSYFDVVPTVVDLLGFAPPTGMHGASVVSSPPAR